MKLKVKKIQFMTFSICFVFFGCLNKTNNDFKTEIKVEKQPEIKGIWIDYAFGFPPLPSGYEGIDFLTKKYKINYKREEFGCEYSEKDILQKKKYEIENQVYFKKLESKLGKDWKQKFDLELKKLNELNAK